MAIGNNLATMSDKNQSIFNESTTQASLIADTSERADNIDELGKKILQASSQCQVTTNSLNEFIQRLKSVVNQYKV